MVRTLALSLSAALSLVSLTLWGVAGAQSDKPAPVRTTVQPCGQYTVRLEENGFGDPPDRISLLRGGRVVVSLTDEMVEFQGCRDLTGDGVPEAMLAQFSGGAHCCFTHSLYSLTTPPRRLLLAFSAHSETLEPAQLDGRGPLELLGDDWRFAYAYGLSFAESPALPVVYSYQNGQYVQNTRSFPAYVLGTTRREGQEEPSGGTYLYDYAVLLLVGKTAEAERYLRSLPAPYRAWLENYAPDIRQDLSAAGMEDWPQRAGVPEQNAAYGISGAFAAPGQRQYLTVIRESGQRASLRLYTRSGDRVVSSPALATFAFPSGTPFSDLRWWPGFTVRRTGGRDDAVLEDRSSGSVRYPVYRVGPQGAAVLKDDPLAVATGLLGDLASVAQHVASQYARTPRDAAQHAEIARRIEVAVGRAQPWLKTGPALDLGHLGNFSVHAIEVSRENAGSALVAGTVDVGFAGANQDIEYVSGDRQTFAIFLEKQGGRWQVTRWQLTPRQGELPGG